MGNSELIFPESGLVVLEFDETATGGVAKFVGGNTKVQEHVIWSSLLYSVNLMGSSRTLIVFHLS
jgi:hypothetical protein